MRSSLVAHRAVIESPRYQIRCTLVRAYPRQKMLKIPQTMLLKNGVVEPMQIVCLYCDIYVHIYYQTAIKIESFTCEKLVDRNNMKRTADYTRKGMHIQAAQKWKKDNPEALAKYQRRCHGRKRTPEEIKKLINRYARRIEELKEVLVEKER